jgi:hypothetical protein
MYYKASLLLMKIPPWQAFLLKLLLKIRIRARCRWLMPIIPATQESEIRRIMVQSHPISRKPTKKD